MKTWFAIGALSCAAALLAAAPSRAENGDADLYYRGRTLTIGVPNPAGGGYDVYVRALSRHLQTHIPGAPTIIVQNVPAAGGLVLANQLFVTSPRDGSVIAMLRGTTLEEEVNGNPQVQFRGRDFKWLANMNIDADTCVVKASSGIRSLKDFYDKEVLVGASGVGAQSYSLPIAYRRILGMKLKMITGYDATGDRLLAMERGELTGSCGISISTYQSQVAQHVRDGKLLLIAQAGLTKDPRFPDVPNILDEAKTTEQRELLEMLLTPVGLGRPIAAPPGTPDPVVDILRRSILEAMKDPDFQSDAARMRIDVQMQSGAETQALVERMYQAPPEMRARLKEALK